MPEPWLADPLKGHARIPSQSLRRASEITKGRPVGHRSSVEVAVDQEGSGVILDGVTWTQPQLGCQF